MKLLHISDLHLGKRLDSVSFLEDQLYILDQVFRIARDTHVDAIIIAGDVYDRSIPPVEATKILNDVLERFSSLDVPIYIVGGNHDSIERLSFGKEFFKKSSIYISSAYDGTLQKETLSDEFGELDVYLLPYVTAIDLKVAHGTEFDTLTDGFRLLIDRANVDTSRRNLIVAHQYVGNPNGGTTDFDESLGGATKIDANVFADTFDYTALGHIHKPYWVLEGKVRYCGSPLKYSINECDNANSVTIVDFKEKGNVQTSIVPLKPLRNVRRLKGSLQNVLDNATCTDDYVDVTLTDEDYILNVMDKVRTVYPNVLKLSFENSKTKSIESVSTSADGVEEKSMLELFADFLSDVYGQTLDSNPNYLDIVKEAIAQCEEDDI